MTKQWQLTCGGLLGGVVDSQRDGGVASIGTDFSAVCEAVVDHLVFVTNSLTLVDSRPWRRWRRDRLGIAAATVGD